jgi:hypothetical protein
MRALPASSPVSPAVPARAAARAPLTVWVYIAFTWLLGWWMALDGLHQRLFGDYLRLGGRLGPWADLALALGVDPQRLGLTFVAVGLGLIGASFGVYLRRRWGYVSALLLSAVCLLYLGFGSPVALVCLILLLLKPTRTYVLLP